MRSSYSWGAAVAGLTLVCGSAMAGPFTAGNLVVSQVGDGSAALTNAATLVKIREFNVGSASFLLNDLDLNAGASGSRLTVSGTATSEGTLSISPSGRYVGIGGYDAAAGTAGVAGSTSATNPRANAFVDLTQGVIYGSYNDAYSANNLRGAVTTDGTQAWMTGANQGIRYGTGIAPSTVVSATVTNTRAVNIANSELMFSTGSGTRGIYTLGGTPSTTGNTATLVFATGAASSPYDFYFASSTVAYVADDTASAAGGVQKWVNSGGVWSLAYTLPTGVASIGARGLTGSVDGLGNVTLYAITAEANANRLIQIVDGGTLGSSTVSTLATAATNTIFRGVEFTPVPTPGTLALLGLGGVLAARRRR